MIRPKLPVMSAIGRLLPKRRPMGAEHSQTPQAMLTAVEESDRSGADCSESIGRYSVSEKTIRWEFVRR
jgi:hypothetical protein